MTIPLPLLTVPTLSTLAGGLLTLHLRQVRPWLEAVGAGLLLGAALLDLMPEALAAGAAGGMSATSMLGLLLVSLLGFIALEMALERWGRGTGRAGLSGQGGSRASGMVGGGMLIFHSLRDGMAIGAAFAVSHRAGYAVLLGIVAHDFADGMNTVLLTTRGERARWSDYAFLAADAVAPFVGGLITMWWLLSARASAVLLTLAAAFFLQMSLGDLLTPPHAGRERSWRLLGCVCGGAGLIALANRLLGAM